MKRALGRADIEIFRGPHVWMARFPHNSAVCHIFGTDTLPTVFRPHVPAHEVKAALEKLNPGARIVFLEEVMLP